MRTHFVQNEPFKTSYGPMPIYRNVRFLANVFTAITWVMCMIGMADNILKLYIFMYNSYQFLPTLTIWLEEDNFEVNFLKILLYVPAYDNWHSLWGLFIP